MNELKKFKNYFGFQHDEDVVCFSSITSTETFYNALVDICREKLVSYKSFRSNFPLCKFSRSRLEAAFHSFMENDDMLGLMSADDIDKLEKSVIEENEKDINVYEVGAN